MLLLSGLLLFSLAGLLVPAYFEGWGELRKRALLTDLRILNDAVARYRDDHGGTLPGIGLEGNGDDELLMRQLVLPTASDGLVLPRGRFGPYLPAGIPRNPFNNEDSVRCLTVPGQVPDDTSGWLYDVKEGRFRSNAREGPRTLGRD